MAINCDNIIDKIDNRKLEDKKCEIHDSENYNYFCSECNINICDYCKEEHDQHHNILDFREIKPKYKEFEEIKLKESNMKKIKEEINEKYQEITKIKNIIIDLTKLINSAENEINLFINKLDSYIKFNDIIIESYKSVKNYYIIQKIKSLNFISKNDIYILYDKPNFRDIEKKIKELKLLVDNNMWISEKYCEEWGIKEGIREIIQNQYDAIISKIKRNNLYVAKKGEFYNNNGNKKYLDYEFVNKNNNKIYGKINYDKKNKILSFSNEGEIVFADFLLGSFKKEQNNAELIGNFGEGMKLAILSLCRKNKNISIISSNKKYTFQLKKDEIFKKDIKCLFCKIHDYNVNSSDKGNVIVSIDNISENEWLEQIDNYLWLINDDDIEIYTSINTKKEELGEIIYSKIYKNKLYVKGIFIKELTDKNNKDNIKSDIPGFNSYNLKLTRDRNSVKNYWDQQSNLSEIMGGCINKNIDYLLNIQGNLGKTFIKTKYGFEETKKKADISFNFEFKNVIKNLINCLNSNSNIYSSYISDKLSNESIELLWKEIISEKEKGKQPTCNQNEIKEFLDERNLNDNFYLTYPVSYAVFKILERSKNYQSIYTRYSEYIEKASFVDFHGRVCEKEINKIVSILKDVIKGLKIDKIKFIKTCNSKENFCFFNNGNYTFSSNKLNEQIDEKWSYWIFIKILELTEKKSFDNYYLSLKKFFNSQ
jgi:hypothetical protein